MKKFKVLRECFLDSRRQKAGAVVEFDDERAILRLVDRGYLQEVDESTPTKAPAKKVETAAATTGGRGRKIPRE